MAEKKTWMARLAHAAKTLSLTSPSVHCICTNCNDAPTGPPALHAKGSHAIQTLLPSKETQQLLKRHLPVKPSVMSFKALRMPTWASNAGPTEAMAPGRRRMLQL